MDAAAWRVGGRLLLALAFVGIGTARGQQPPPSKTVTRSTAFRLPVRLGDGDREGLKEIRFYAKCPPGGWELKETAPPSQAGFTFRAPGDGEYWFSFVTVDRDGRMHPPGPEGSPPGLIVVVDTTPP